MLRFHFPLFLKLERSDLFFKAALRELWTISPEQITFHPWVVAAQK